ncbi:MAG: LacI family transcriptional regulator [Acholeplasma sp.]|nr:MAG: LacI family transcriptional regulator [Acholeplasma sp.]
MDDRKNIYTIAKELNLSPSTISKALNNTGSINEKTRERVLNYIKDVGYVPTSSARKLKSKRSFTIGIVFTEESNIGLEHSFFSSILQNFKTYVENKGYELAFIVTKLGQHQMSYYEWCLNKRVDGIYIVVGNYNDKGLYELVGKGIPCVSTDMILNGIHTVISDNEQGVSLVLHYIKDHLKKTRIAVISGPKSSKAFEERVNLCKSIWHQLGFQLTDDHIEFAESFGFTSGYQGAMRLIERMKTLPEVIFVTSDDLALGVIKYLDDHQIRIPDQIQVIGFDDIAFARNFTPPLTTIRQDRMKLGATAGKLLIDMIEQPDLHFPTIYKCPVELIIRETTKEET